METAVRKATRLDYNPPKQKHLSTLISLTFHNPMCLGDMFNLLERRHRENSWIMSFKVLVIFHILMRQGNGDRTIAYIEKHPACLDTTRLREKSSGVIHIQNIYLYTSYLQQKVDAYRELHVDYIKTNNSSKVGRLRRLSVNDGLLKETMVLQKQVSALLKCKFILNDVDNTISVFAFRLVVEDLLVLFQVINEGVVNILEQYFAMPKADALTSLEIYKRFTKQTEEVIAFLDRARHFQQEMHIAIPAVKHAPTSLIAALEEYLADLNDQSCAPPEINKGPTATTAFTTASANPTSVHRASEQSRELADFFISLEPTSVTPQPSLHNPFRNTASGNPSSFQLQLQQQNNLIMGPCLWSQQQPSMHMASLPSTHQLLSSPASPLPTNVNPFKMGTNTQQQANQPSSSFPFLLPPSATPQFSNQQPPGTLQQQQVTMSTENNVFKPSTPTTSSNPFTQQQQQLSFQTPQSASMNPFGMSISSPQQQNQHQSSWGPSSVF